MNCSNIEIMAVVGYLLSTYIIVSGVCLIIKKKVDKYFKDRYGLDDEE